MGNAHDWSMKWSFNWLYNWRWAAGSVAVTT
jgi:hypothetical protein